MLEKLQGEFVQAHDLKIVSKEFFDEQKAMIETKAKSYCAIVWAQSPITALDCEKLTAIRDMKVL